MSRLATQALLVISLAMISAGCNDHVIAAPPAAAPPPPPPVALASAPPPASTLDTREEAWPPPAATSPRAAPEQIKIEDHLQQLVGTVEDALRDHAAKLISCPKDQIKMRPILLGRPRNPLESVFADGCGQRVVYGSSPAYGTALPYPEFYVVSRFSMGR